MNVIEKERALYRPEIFEYQRTKSDEYVYQQKHINNALVLLPLMLFAMTLLFVVYLPI